ncbi:peptidyl-prolyl cis-trans isomerase FKBP2 isoform X1 [Poecilia latipinna]|uniref:peptidyl-prolyl cis-trans isomerase FKBP2 isoform X1 n=1 Tax=Poecilia latipinna TaxID=48699 RepID=UPI00072D9CC3|nr:PREDICTED: peptidyl-prolyl cis-trans isomerase FKBP2 isoform X1 [Poecilia latipinna]
MFSPNILRNVYPVTPGGEPHPVVLLVHPFFGKGFSSSLFQRSYSVTMRLLLLVVMAALSLGPAAVSGADKKKLQIGIKKRVDNCPIKSRKGDVLNMHYTGKLEDGTEFDSSIPRGQPFTFTLGTGQVIKGWDQGLLGMCEGEKRKLVIPAELGYGDRGAPPKIPGGATLIFEVELLSIERRSDL